MQVRFAIAASVVFAFAATAATASDFPTRRAGLWQISMHIDSAKMGAMGSKMCVDGTTDAKMMKYGMSQQGSECSPPSISGFGATRTVDAVCHMNGGTQKTHMTIAYADDSSYHIDMQTKFDPPFYGRAQSHQTQDAKWMGPCPAGMKPGDMEMPGGYKVNVLDSMANPAAGARLTPAQIQAIIKAHGGH